MEWNEVLDRIGEKSHKIRDNDSSVDAQISRIEERINKYRVELEVWGGFILGTDQLIESVFEPEFETHICYPRLGYGRKDDSFGFIIMYESEDLTYVANYGLFKLTEVGTDVKELAMAHMDDLLRRIEQALDAEIERAGIHVN